MEVVYKFLLGVILVLLFLMALPLLAFLLVAWAIIMVMALVV